MSARWWSDVSLRITGGHPLGTAAILVLLTLLGVWSAARNTFDHDLRDLLDESQRAFAAYEQSVELFGPDDDIFVAMPMDGLGTESLRLAIWVREAISDLPGVARVFDLAAACNLKDEAALDRLLEEPRLFERRLRELGESTILRGLLLGHSHNAQSLIVRTAPLSNHEKQQLVCAIDERLRIRFPGLAFHLSGYQVFGESYIRHTMMGNRRFLVLSLLIALATAWLVFRSAALTATVLLAIALPVAWAHGLYAALGYRMTLYSSLLTPIILFVGLSLAMQFIARYRLAWQISNDHQNASSALTMQARFESNPFSAVLVRTLQDALPPGFLCAFTTLLGFASQVLSPVPGIRAFGLFSSIGCGFAFVAVFLVLPLFFSRFPALGMPRMQVTSESSVPPRRLRDFGFHAGRILARWSLHPGLVVSLMLIATLILGAGIPGLRLGSDPLSALPPDDPAVTGFAFFSHHFSAGERQISLVLRSNSSGFDSAEGFGLLKRVEERLASDPEVLAVLGPARILQEVHTSAFGPPPASGMTTGDIDRAIRFTERDPDSWLGGFLNAPFRDRARIMVGLKHPEAPRVTAAAKRLEALVATCSENGLTASATGRMLLSALMEQEALSVEIGSFAGSLAGILLVIGIGFGSLRAILVGAIPNLLPIIWTLGLLGWLGESLDPVTAMVPCICLGIVVDDTIHLIHETIVFEQRGYGWRRNRAAVMIRIGWAVFSTSLILVAGLGVLGWSEFRPIRGFGLFAAMTIACAPLFDLFLTPALLALTAARRR